ncbi:hypothetical protein M3223_15365 [Paenibacillus pasadenensis]|uniref:transglutaminase domain-containing protein n=1 Tax=Paenibacillus pasadenensis TaxID=217090 RepID=UPI00203C0BF9|nr:transglutaminase domain-containing protein [Paenibacillus pasadenensis]MCM3748730.1 hypothetical protein [Paenibacillus pasadenensis]
MRHWMANLLLAFSLAISIYVVEARVNEAVQADRLPDAAVSGQADSGLEEMRREADNGDSYKQNVPEAGVSASSESEQADSGLEEIRREEADASVSSETGLDPAEPDESDQREGQLNSNASQDVPAMELDAGLADEAADEKTAPQSETDSRSALVNGLAEGFQQRQTKFELSFQGEHEKLVDLMPELVQQGLFQEDYTAYVLKSYAYKIRSANGKSSISMTAEYRETLEQSAAVAKRSKAMLKELLDPGMDDEEKVRAIHDWIVRHVRYDESLSRYTAYEALTLRSAVCQGYALLVYRMLNDAGIETRIVEGTVESGDHAWNLVRLGGGWYHLDATWDDPLPDRGNEVSHKYYLLSDSEMAKDHKWTKDYPEAPESYR